MPNIRLTDQFGLDLDIQPNSSSAFARYFRNLTRFRFSDLNAAELRDTSLGNLPVQRVQAGLTTDVEAGPTDLTLGAAAGLAVVRPSAAADPLLSLSVTAQVSAGAFGFAAGTSFEVANSRPFPAATAFGEALRVLVAGYTLPRDAEDLAALDTGVISTVGGRGSLKFSGTASLLTAVNPLASLHLPLPQGLPEIQTGGALEVAASVELSTEYEVRVEKLAGRRVRVGWHRRKGAEFVVSVTAKAGLLGGGGGGAGALAGQVLGGLMAEPPSGDFLRDTGLSRQQIDDLDAAVKAGVERRLDLAVGFELGALRTDDAAFLYEVDLGGLDDSGAQALRQALRGDLSALTAAEDALPAGIRLVQSIFTAVRQTRHTFRVNLLGIYNLRSVSELTRVGQVLYDPASGDLVLTDRATASELLTARVNFGADSQKLRKLLADTFLITAAYRASKLVVEAPQLETSHTYFELNAAAERQDMKNNLDVAQALGLLSNAAKQEKLGQSARFGATTLFAETRYNDQRTERLFLDDRGEPRDQAEFERAGREALQLLVQPDDPDAFRRRPAIDDDLWGRMQSLGQANFASLFSPTQLGAVIADYTLIIWWAETMRQTAEKLAEVRRFFAGPAPPSPDDPEFRKLREDLARQLASVAKNTKPQFGDPWGLVAMDRVSGRQAPARVEITGPLVALRLERRGTDETTGRVAGAGSGSGGV